MFSIYLQILDDPSKSGEFEEFYLRYRDKMYKTAYAILKDEGHSEDAVHEAFFRMAKFFSRIYKLNYDEQLRYTLITTRNIALNIINKHSHEEVTYDIEMHNFRKETVKSAQDEYLEISDFQFIVNTIRELPSALSDTLYLYLVADMTNREIASLTGFPIDTVKKRVQRGKKILRQKLKEYKK